MKWDELSKFIDFMYAVGFWYLLIDKFFRK